MEWQVINGASWQSSNQTRKVSDACTPSSLSYITRNRPHTPEADKASMSEDSLYLTEISRLPVWYYLTHISTGISTTL